MSKDPANSASIQDVVSFLEANLSPFDWDVSVSSVSPEGFLILIDHPLSSQQRLSMDDRQTIRFVENFLHHREFEIVANAPAPTPHHSLIKKLRGSGRAGHFDSDALAIVARILVSESLLTDSEAKWLETAGPAWMTSEEAGDQP